MKDSQSILAPESARFLELMDHHAKGRYYEINLQTLRNELEALVSLWGGPREFIPYIEDVYLAGGLDLRIYHPSVEKTLPLLFYIHGGGWTRGNLYSHDKVCRALAHRLHMRVIAVNYHLSPEYPFPHGLEDVKRVYQWILDNQVRLAYDSGKIFMGGDSGGGNLSAALVSSLIEEKKSLPACLFLLYPSLDLTGSSPSMEELSTGCFLTKDAVLAFIHNYLGGDLSQAHHWEVSPLFYPQLAQFPPTHILVCGADPIRDDGVRFHEALVNAAVPTSFLCLKGTLHAFLQFYSIFKPQCDETYGWMAEQIKPYL